METVLVRTSDLLGEVRTLMLMGHSITENLLIFCIILLNLADTVKFFFWFQGVYDDGVAIG